METEGGETPPLRRKIHLDANNSRVLLRLLRRIELNFY